MDDVYTVRVHIQPDNIKKKSMFTILYDFPLRTTERTVGILFGLRGTLTPSITV